MQVSPEPCHLAMSHQHRFLAYKVEIQPLEWDDHRKPQPPHAPPAICLLPRPLLKPCVTNWTLELQPLMISGTASLVLGTGYACQVGWFSYTKALSTLGPSRLKLNARLVKVAMPSLCPWSYVVGHRTHQHGHLTCFLILIDPHDNELSSGSYFRLT